LPEAQRDRFTARISVGYPDLAAELAMVDEHAAGDPLDTLRPVADAGRVRAVIETVRLVHVSPEVRQYCVELVGGTRRHPDLRLGASPRATLQLVRTAKAQAAMSGRGYVVPDDVQAVAVPVLAHRLLLAPEAAAARRSAAEIVRGLIGRQPVPVPARPGY
jgi:MoxR-like ATPase